MSNEKCSVVVIESQVAEDEETVWKDERRVARDQLLSSVFGFKLKVQNGVFAPPHQPWRGCRASGKLSPPVLFLIFDCLLTNFGNVIFKKPQKAAQARVFLLILKQIITDKYG